MTDDEMNALCKRAVLFQSSMEEMHLNVPLQCDKHCKRVGFFECLACNKDWCYECQLKSFVNKKCQHCGDPYSSRNPYDLTAEWFERFFSTLDVDGQQSTGSDAWFGIENQAAGDGSETPRDDIRMRVLRCCQSILHMFRLQ